MTTSTDRPASPFGPVQTVAVIGAGISGVTAATHLLRAGLSVTVFERGAASGGVWNYDPRPSLDPPFPNETPSEGDYKTSIAGEHAYNTPPPGTSAGSPVRGAVEVKDDSDAPSSIDALAHAPPSACYAGLKNNIPLPLMTTSLAPYPPETPDVGPWTVILEYIQTLSKTAGVDAITHYHTRVEEVKKGAGGWNIRTLTLSTADGVSRWRERTWAFDAVVVASGHYHAPRVPDIPGLREWKTQFPDRVVHSKQYRTPETFRGRNVLLVGGGVSSGDIARELDGVASKVYQSVRGGLFDLSASLLPKGAQRVAGVKTFGSITAAAGEVELGDGTVLHDVDNVVLATGYLTSYPFLAHLHSDKAPASEAGDHLLVTADGGMTHNLHRDVFYMPDPSLAFLGVPFHLSAFPTVDFQSQAIARVFSGQAAVPSEAEMREEYREKVQKKGLGHIFHCYLHKGGELEYVAGLVEWVNRDARARGTPEIQGHSDDFVALYWKLREDARGVFADQRAWGDDA